MVTLHWFLETLGLDASADERAIKRAYAQRLKLIDQATQPAEFQQLRDAYDRSLAWATSRPEPAANPPVSNELVPANTVTVTPSVTGQTALLLENPERVAAEVFRKMCSAMDEQPPTTSAARQLLEQALANEQMLLLGARPAFSHMLAVAICSKWTPWDAPMFEAAVALLDWQHDASTLKELGEIQFFLYALLDEYDVWSKLTPSVQLAGTRVILATRNASNLSDFEISDIWDSFQKRIKVFPNWLRLCAGPSNVEILQQRRATQLANWKKPMGSATNTGSDHWSNNRPASSLFKEPSSFPWWLVWIAIFTLIRFVAHN